VRLGNINHRVRVQPLRSVHKDSKNTQSVDGFSGWSDSVNGEQGNDSQNKKKKSYGGMYGSSNSTSC
ncbi:hypothetical protein L195_g039343, partial [Trifolium pratense]